MTAFCSASDPGRSWGWLPSTQANGSFAPLCEFGIGRLTERLGEVNRETEAFWPFNSR
jgi:hypothetical protein